MISPQTHDVPELRRKAFIQGSGRGISEYRDVLFAFDTLKETEFAIARSLYFLHF